MNAGLDGSCLFKKLSVILEENPTMLIFIINVLIIIVYACLNF